MSANMVLSLWPVIGDLAGPSTRSEIFGKVGLKHLPGPEEPVRERQVHDLHHEVRQHFGDAAHEVLEAAGIRAAETVAEYRIPPRARTLMRKMPWPVATWLLIRSAQQHAWTFSGSGTFRLLTTSTFEVSDNPVIRGETNDQPICIFHQALFQSLFQRVVNAKLTCTELACCAQGNEACRFELAYTV